MDQITSGGYVRILILISALPGNALIGAGQRLVQSGAEVIVLTSAPTTHAIVEGVKISGGEPQAMPSPLADLARAVLRRPSVQRSRTGAWACRIAFFRPDQILASSDLSQELKKVRARIIYGETEELAAKLML